MEGFTTVPTSTGQAAAAYSPLWISVQGNYSGKKTVGKLKLQRLSPVLVHSLLQRLMYPLSATTTTLTLPTSTESLRLAGYSQATLPVHITQLVETFQLLT